MDVMEMFQRLSAARHPFRPQRSVLQPIVKLHFDQISAAGKRRIGAGEISSSAVITLAHMYHQLTRTLTENFLTFVERVLQRNLLNRTSSQVEAKAALETLDIILEDTMSLVLADVLLIPPPQCEDMKKLTALLETEVKTRVGSLLRSNKKVLFVPAIMSSISTLQLLVGHTLKCLKTSLSGQSPSRPLAVPPRTRRTEAAETSSSSFFHFLFESEFERMLEKLHQLLQVKDQSKSPHVGYDKCVYESFKHTVVGSREPLCDPAGDHLDNVDQRQKAAGRRQTNVLRDEIQKLTTQLTERVYERMLTKGDLLADSGVLDRDSDLIIMTTEVHHSEVEEAVEMFLQQVLLYLDINPPQPAAVCIDHLDTTTPPSPAEDNASWLDYDLELTPPPEVHRSVAVTAGPSGDVCDLQTELSRAVTSPEENLTAVESFSQQQNAESLRTSRPEEVQLSRVVSFILVSKLLKCLPKKSRRLLHSEDVADLVDRVRDAVLKDVGSLIVTVPAQRKDLKKVIQAAVKHLCKTFESPQRTVELAFRPGDTTFVDAVGTFLRRHLTERMSAPPKRSWIARFFSLLFGRPDND